MPKTKRVMKTVAFFEVRGENEEELQPIDWQDTLRDIEAEASAAGTIDVVGHDFNDATHYGQVHIDLDGERHMILAREREEPPSSLDRRTGQLLDEEMDVNRPWVEVSILTFYPGSNVFGIVLGSGAAPRATALADWLNAHDLFVDPLTVTAHLSEELLQRLEDGASQARLVSMRLSSEEIMSQQSATGMYEQLRSFGRELDLGPEIEVEVTLSIRGRTDQVSSSALETLGDIGRGLARRRMKAGRVELIEDEDAGTNRELVDLVKLRMTTKERVSVLDDDEGSQVRIPSAVEAIARAAYNLNILGRREQARGDDRRGEDVGGRG